MPIASARCRRTPALIDGLSWSALALVLAFCALTSLESMLSPHTSVFGSGREMVLVWLVRIPIFMVNGVTVLITALVVLNAAGRAGRLNPVLAVAAAVAGCLVASVTRYAIGATPAADGPAFMVSSFITWFIPAATLVAGYVFYLHTRGVQKIRMGARLESSIDVPGPLLEGRVPSMMLATLVENAIKHGIGPLAEGGAIRLAAAREGETLVLSVADTGHGFAAASGSGV